MCSKEIQLVLGIIITILDLIKFLVPLLLIILCTIDLFKLIVTKKEDEIKKLRKDIFRKIIYAVIIYLIPFIVSFIFNFANKILPIEYDNSWEKCWNYVKDSKKSN